MGFSLPWEHGYVPSVTTMDGTPLALDVDYLEQGRERLLHQFQGRPRLEAVQGVLLGQLQHVEIALWQLWAERRLPVATFDALRVLARKLGLRGYDAMIDSLLRRLALSWIRAGRSSGTPEDFLSVARLFVGADAAGGRVADYRNYYPGAVRIALRVLMTTPDAPPGTLAQGAEGHLLARVLRRAGTAGVRVDTEYLVEDLDHTFTLSEELASEDDVSDELGLGAGDVDEDLGGALAGVTTGEE